ncbi:MAG: Glucokinase, partial [Pseudomonadota bacterium]
MEALFPWLLGDIGATHARFAWVSSKDQPLSHVRTLLCDDHQSLLSAVQQYLKEASLPAPQKAALGVATPVVGDKVSFTNRSWAFSIQEMKQSLG